MVVGSTPQNCPVHGQTIHVIVEIKNSTAKATLCLCKKCIERKENERDY